jgi:hypothetical protein
METLEGRAQARQLMGRLEEALEDANRMLKIDKTNPRVCCLHESTVNFRHISVWEDHSS